MRTVSRPRKRLVGLVVSEIQFSPSTSPHGPNSETEPSCETSSNKKGCKRCDIGGEKNVFLVQIARCNYLANEFRHRHVSSHFANVDWFPLLHLISQWCLKCFAFNSFHWFYALLQSRMNHHRSWYQVPGTSMHHNLHRHAL
jgi:hypothetical protein